MAWAAAAGGAAGGLVGGAISAISSSAEGAKARSFAADMYRHRYRWAMADMRKAGLNPILAATQGIGGSVSGASIPSMPDFSAATAKGVEAAVKANEQRAKLDPQTELIREQINYTRALKQQTWGQDLLTRAGIPEAEAKKQYDLSPQGNSQIMKNREFQLNWANTGRGVQIGAQAVGAAATGYKAVTQPMRK